LHSKIYGTITWTAYLSIRLSTHASFRPHLWTFMHAGQRSGILRFAANESSTIVSVVSPVGTSLPRIGQRIMMLGKEITLRITGKDWRFAGEKRL
jgi:hypothetical protein